MKPPVLFVNIAWMKYYDGPKDDDVLNPGNFGYFRRTRGAQTKVGHEQWNFRSQQGRVVGYVPRSSGVNITRLGASAGDDTIDGVLVVFIARDPVADKLKAVGWYENATVARESRFTRVCDGTHIDSPISASASDAFPIQVADRGEPFIPTAQTTSGGIGQSPLWYAEEHPETVEQVLALVAGLRRRRVSPVPESGSPRNPDPEARLAVEKRSMDLAMAYFSGAVDVSKLKRGWDIEAQSIHGTALIEVKGLSGPDLVIELTPREYEKMLEHRERYIVFVVTLALTRSAFVRVFRFNPGATFDSGVTVTKGAWRDDNGTMLIVSPRTGARCSI